mgnify:CR=1 FL=1
MKIDTIKTLGELKKAGYVSKSIKDELRHNLREKIKSGKPVFEGVHGFENTVIPELERAILSRHNINLLGLRGQAKTRLARKMTELLDEYMPVVEGSEINDDPLNPISRYAKELIADKKEDTPIRWIHRNDRFFENDPFRFFKSFKKNYFVVLIFVFHLLSLKTIIFFFTIHLHVAIFFQSRRIEKSSFQIL